MSIPGIAPAFAGAVGALCPLTGMSIPGIDDISIPDTSCVAWDFAGSGAFGAPWAFAAFVLAGEGFMDGMAIPGIDDISIPDMSCAGAVGLARFAGGDFGFDLTVFGFAAALCVDGMTMPGIDDMSIPECGTGGAAGFFETGFATGFFAACVCAGLAGGITMPGMSAGID